MTWHFAQHRFWGYWEDAKESSLQIRSAISPKTEDSHGNHSGQWQTWICHPTRQQLPSDTSLGPSQMYWQSERRYLWHFRHHPIIHLVHQVHKPWTTCSRHFVCALTSKTVHRPVCSSRTNIRSNWCSLKGPISVFRNHEKPHRTVSRFQHIPKQSKITTIQIKTHESSRWQSSRKQKNTSTRPL